MHTPFFPMAAWAVLGLALITAARAEGLKPVAGDAAWPRWQARIELTSTPALRQPWRWGAFTDGLRLQSARLLGDYYFTGPVFAAAQGGGGFRATSGLIWGRRGTLWSTGRAGDGMALSLSHQSLSPALADPGSADTVPYVGVGYTGGTARSGWSFSADLGLAATSGASGLRLGRPAGESLDDNGRDLRISPVLQLGVSHAF